MINAKIPQPGLNQAGSTSTQYINKVTLADDGTLTVTKTPVVPTNLLTPLPTTTTTVSTTNQILAGSKVVITPTVNAPDVITVGSDGRVINPEPPGPPGYTP